MGDCVSNSFSPGQSGDDNLLTFICLHPERLRGSRCKSATIMTGVSPPERALYNQKIILLFPVAPLILSSSKQPWEVWRRTTETIPTPANNTQMLQCRHDYTQGKAFLFSLSSSHAPPVAHTSGKYMDGKRAGRGCGICTACLCWQPCWPVFLCCIMLVWVC